MRSLLRFRKLINPPYSARDLLVILGTLVILVAIPFTISLSLQRPSLAPQAASSTVTFDSASSAVGKNGGENLALIWPHTTSGSNRILMVGVSLARYYPIIPSGATSVTYNGAALTKVGVVNIETLSVELWYLVAPSIGTHEVIVTFINTNFVVGGATSWTGVDQSSPLGIFASNKALIGSPFVNVSTAPGEVVLDILGAWKTSPYTMAAGPSQTKYWSQQTSIIDVGGGW